MNAHFAQLQKICGEIYEVDDAKLVSLDKLENHPDFYVRRLERVTLDGSDNHGEQTHIRKQHSAQM